jgi:HSP20 family protein
MAETKETKEAMQHESNQPAKGSQQSRQVQPTQRGLARRTGPFWNESPFALMNQLTSEMEQLFENFGLGRGFGDFGGRSFWNRGLRQLEQSIWSPQIEVMEREGHIIVRADLPGLAKDDVKVEITDDAVTLQGERKHEHEQCDESFCRSERSFGRFYRSIPLPDGIDAEKAKADFRDGVLEITIPAPQRESRRRQIEIGEGTDQAAPRAGAQTTGKS